VETPDLPDKEQLSALSELEDTDTAGEFVRRFLAASKAGKLQMMQEHPDLMRRIEETFGDIGQDELPAEAQALMADLITFHLQTGWEVAEDTHHGDHGHRWTLTRGERRRYLIAHTMFGTSTASLAEQPRQIASDTELTEP
jgi:hypothetical protein